MSSILFINNFRRGMGGGEVQLLHVIRACLGAGMRVTLACPVGAALGEQAASAGAEVVRVRFPPLGMSPTIGYLAHLARERDVRIVQGTGFLTNLVARRVGELANISVVNMVQVVPGASVLDGGSVLDLWLRSRVDRATVGRVTAFVAVSDAVADALRASGVPSDRLRVIPNAVDVEAVQTAAAMPLPPGFPSRRPLVGVVARLEPVKGVDVFLRAAALLAPKHPQATFVIVGDGSVVNALRRLAAELGLSGNVRFLGPVHPAAPVIAALDIVVAPSRSEGLPIVPLEAMVLGKPMVATAVGGMPEAVADGVTGILVSPDDPAALALAMGALLDDPGRARVLGDAGRARVEERFALPKMTSAYLALYEELLAR